jgi:hypothetical protein
MTNEQLLIKAKMIIERCKSQETGQGCVEIEKAINTISVCKKDADTVFCYAILRAEIDDFERIMK